MRNAANDGAPPRDGACDARIEPARSVLPDAGDGDDFVQSGPQFLVRIIDQESDAAVLADRAALGMFMLGRVFKDIATFRSQGIPLRRVAMNLTNSDFRSDVFLDCLFKFCDETGIDPNQFCLEVTEGMFLHFNQKRVDSGLRQLHAAGVEIALDDFGAGYASLPHLRRLPIDRIEIDQSFVANIVAAVEDNVADLAAALRAVPAIIPHCTRL